MIQRIQSIYLLLAALGFGLFFALPFATSSKPVTSYMQDMIYNVSDHVVMQILTIAGILVSLAAIFLYQNRTFQVRLTILSIVCAVLVPLTAVLLMLTDPAPASADTEMIKEKVGIATPLLPIIFGFLAYKGIKKDDKLVRSMDRLR